MIINSIGTNLYTLLFGRMVAKDNVGNKFYIHKKIKGKRWVIYKNSIDPTALETKWQIWLTNIDINHNDLSMDKNYIWQKNKKANLTGTTNSYHPGTSLNKRNNNIKSDKNAIWKPE